MSCEAGTVSLYGDGSLHLRPYLSDQSEICCLLTARVQMIFLAVTVSIIYASMRLTHAKLPDPENTAREYLEILRLVEISYQSAEKAKRITIEHS